MAELLQSTAQTVVGRGYLSSDHISTATGLDPAITISKNGGNFANPAAGASVMTEIESTGWYKFALGTSDTDTLGPLIIRGTHATMDNIEVVFQVIAVSVAQTGDAYAIVNHTDYGNAKLVRSTTPANALDVSATGEAGLDFANVKAATAPTTLTNITVPTVTTLTGHTPQTGDAYAIVSNATYGNSALETLVDGLKADTTEILTRIPDATPGANGGLPTVNASNQIAGIAGTKSTLDSLNDLAAQAVADALKLAPTAGDPAAGSVNKHLDDLITSVADVPTNSELTTALGTLNDITVADIIAGITEGSLDLQEMLRIILAAVAGKATGGGTTSIAFRDQADTKNRIVATVDTSGNRSAVTVDGS